MSKQPLLSLCSPALSTPQTPHSVQPHICSSLFLAFQVSGTFQRILCITPCFLIPLPVFAQPEELLGFSSNLLLPLWCMEVATLTFLLPGSGPHLSSFQLFSSSWPQNPHFAISHNGGSFSIPPL